MNYWNNTRKKYIQIETSIIFFVGLIIIYGLFCDVLASIGIAIIVVHNLNGLSLTMLQIQATLTTLVIAVVALLTGSISDSYMGISISSYYMDIRPYVLKWKVVTLTEFSLLGINVLCHIFELYNLVIAIFAASLIILVIYILEINDVFKGRDNSLNEIKEYYEWLLKNSKQYEKNGKQFVLDWKSSINVQSSADFNAYFDMFMCMIFQIMENESNLKLVNSFAEEMAVTLLEDDSQTNKIKGIKFIDDYYNRIVIWVDNNKESASKVKDQIHLIDMVAHEWYVAVKSLDAETIEREVNLKYLAKNVIRLSACLGFDKEKSLSEPNAINSIARAWGIILDKLKKRGNVIDPTKWERTLLESYEYHSYGIPEDSIDFFMDSYALYDFFLCYGYLLNGSTEIVKNAVFLDDIGNQHKVECKAYLYKVMLIHCFMYYLGFRESTDCVDESVKKVVYEMATNTQIVSTISHFYFHLIDDLDCLNPDVEKNMEELLRHFELFPKHSNGKAIIIEEIVRDYYLYIALIIHRYTFRREKLVELLDVDTYYSYLFDYKKNEIISRFVEIGSLFDDNSDENALTKKAEDMYGIFESVMNEKYKKEIIEDASLNQRKFEEDHVLEKTKEKIKHIMSEKFDSLFGEMNASVMPRTYKKVHVMSSIDYTKYLGENLRSAYSDYPFANFMAWLVKELNHSFNIEVINRDEEFKSDSEFRDYLKRGNYDLLLGSSYTFCCEDYDDYKIHNEFINSYKVFYVPTTGFGIALKHNDLCIRLDDVIVDIYSPTINEVNAVRNEETGLYSYSPVSGLKLDFEEGELREYIHDERKMIRVYFNVAIGIKDYEDYKSCVIISRND